MTTPVSGIPPVAEAVTPEVSALSTPLAPLSAAASSIASAEKPAEKLTEAQVKFRAELEGKESRDGNAYDLDLEVTSVDKPVQGSVPTNTGCHTATGCPSNPCPTNPCKA